MFHSNFKPFSIGVAVADKDRDSRTLRIYPVEILPHMSEEIDDSTRERKKQGVDHTEKLYTVVINEQAWLPADWIGSTYFEKAPDVAKGEQILIYRNGDSDKYYWDVFGRDDANRKQEDVIISFSAKPEYDSGEPVPKDETNSYRLRFNTYEKFIELTTSEANGEETTYKMKFDMAAANWELVDKDTNRFFLDTKNTFIEFFNKENTYIRMDKKEIFMRSDDLIQMDTSRLNINCDNMTINVNDTMSMSAQTANLNFATCTIGQGNWTINANCTFNKSVVMSAGFSAGAQGVAAFGGNVTFSIPLSGYDKFPIKGT